MAVEDHPTQIAVKRRTLKLKGRIGTQDVLILVDSGSVATFISEHLAAKLQCSTQLCTETKFLAADGSPMSCTRRIPELQWEAQGHLFTVNAGILPFAVL